jgi:DNA-binding GntR family transcriptional regulator
VRNARAPKTFHEHRDAALLLQPKAMAKKTFLGLVSDPGVRSAGASRRAPASATDGDAGGDAPAPRGAASESNGDDEPRTLIEQACARLRDDIIEGRLAPDDKLRVEHLRQHYGVSAGTLREALTRLVSDALVVAEGQRGFRVAPIALQDLIDLTELRVHIELDALRQSIRKGDEAWRLRVRQAFDELSKFEQPVKPEHRHEWERLNTRFHEALISAHASSWTLKLLRMLARHGERYRRYAMRLPGSARNVHAEHTELCELAVGGKEARAALSLEAHIRNTSDLLVNAERDGVRWNER